MMKLKYEDGSVTLTYLSRLQRAIGDKGKQFDIYTHTHATMCITSILIPVIHMMTLRSFSRMGELDLLFQSQIVDRLSDF